VEQGFELRSVFNENVVIQFAESITENYPKFDRNNFTREINNALPSLQFGERSELITKKLHQFLPSDFPHAVEILLNSLGPEIEDEELTGMEGFIIMSQCRFVSRYGLDYFDLSMNALYEMTKRFSAEGDIRFFIDRYPEMSLSLLSDWTEDPNCHVRRLVSEGTRPRLPLAGRIARFQKDPEPVLILLEKLKNDPVRYVQRSVANNLNDISKDNPECVIKKLKEWKKSADSGIQWIISHALRSLIKAGNSEGLELLGYSTKLQVKLLSFKLENRDIQFGHYLNFNFEIQSEETKKQNLMIDYKIYFKKSNGTLAGKVFKLSRKIISPNETIRINKRHSIKPISTRKYYPGDHRIELILNGRKYAEEEFSLIV
jgi:3-methyladenine DNA glycosylase AlkC